MNERSTTRGLIANIKVTWKEGNLAFNYQGAKFQLSQFTDQFNHSGIFSTQVELKWHYFYPTSTKIAAIDYKLMQSYLHKSYLLSFIFFRYEHYVHGKSVSELPPTYSAIYGHLLRCFCTFQLQKSLLNYDDFNLTPENYGRRTEGSVLCPQKHQVFMPKEYIFSCQCQKGSTGRRKCKSFEESTSTEFSGCAGKFYIKILSWSTQFQLFFILWITWISYQSS